MVDAVDDAVPTARTPANQVLQDDGRLIRWVGVLFLACAILIVPWVFYIGFSLPQRQLSEHYAIAWAGFDVGLFVALGLTAWAVLRRTTWVGMTAGATAALLVTDAWFDVVTSSPGMELVGAAAMAALVELPLAAICIWLCQHTKFINDRRIRILLSRDCD